MDMVKERCINVEQEPPKGLSGSTRVPQQIWEGQAGVKLHDCPSRGRNSHGYCIELNLLISRQLCKAKDPSVAQWNCILQSLTGTVQQEDHHCYIAPGTPALYVHYIASVERCSAHDQSPGQRTTRMIIVF